MEKEQSQNRDAIALQKLRQLVLDNIQDEQFGVEELASSYGISRSQLHRNLKKLTKKSISRFIREIRLDEAHKMLRQEAGTVSEIAYRVGFSSPTYFNTCFRDYFGYPPGETVIRGKNGDNPKVPQGSAGIVKANTLRSKRNRVYFLIIAALILIIAGTYYILPKESDSEVQSVASSESTSNIPEKSIAILPLKNLTGDPEQEYISDGMTDAVISRLTSITAMDKVVPITATLPFKNTATEIPEIAQNLGVNYILEGSFQRFGENFKIDVRLISAPTNQLRWSESFSGTWEVNDIFDIQAEIAENIASRMEVHIKEEELKDLRRSYTSDQEAYNDFLRAEYYLLRLSKEEIEKSKEYYERAISIDPQFVDAYIRLAVAWSISGWVWGIHDENLAWERAKALYNDALILAAGSEKRIRDIRASRDIGSYLFEWNFADARIYFEEYMNYLKQADSQEFEYTKDMANVLLAADYARHNGFFEEAILIGEDLSRKQPGTAVVKAQIQTFMGQEEAALEWLTVQDRLHSDKMYYLMESAQLYYYLGAYHNFDINLNKLIANFEDRPPRILWLKALDHNIKNQELEEKEYIDAIYSLYAKEAPGSPAWFLALYYAHLGDRENCISWLQRSFDRHEVEMIWLRTEPLLDFVKCDPRYFELYKKVGFLTKPPCELKDNNQQIIELN